MKKSDFTFLMNMLNFKLSFHLEQITEKINFFSKTCWKLATTSLSKKY